MRSWESARPPEKIGQGSDSQDRMDQQDSPEHGLGGLKKNERDRCPLLIVPRGIHKIHQTAH